MTKLLGRLVTIVDVIGLEAFVPEPPRGTGRPPEYRRALARGFVAKTGLGIPTTSALIERLAIDKSLRRILGWERCAQVPSEATFSRAFAAFAQGELPDKMHAALIERALGGRIIGAIARDATEIKAREKPVEKSNNDKDGPSPPPTSAWLTVGVEPQRKRGRPRKGRSGQTRSHHVSNGKQCTTSLGYSPISPPRAMSAPRRTARAIRRHGSAISCISMSPAAKFLSLAC